MPPCLPRQGKARNHSYVSTWPDPKSGGFPCGFALSQPENTNVKRESIVLEEAWRISRTRLSVGAPGAVAHAGLEGRAACKHLLEAASHLACFMASDSPHLGIKPAHVVDRLLGAAFFRSWNHGRHLQLCMSRPQVAFAAKPLLTFASTGQG